MTLRHFFTPWGPTGSGSTIEHSEFVAEYSYIHTTSSPQYPQSNGEAKRAMQTIKQFSGSPQGFNGSSLYFFV